MRTYRRSLGRSSRGFTFVVVLALIALMSIGLASASSHWSHQARREREADIIRTGEAYANAIRHYYRRSPDGRSVLPPSLDVLIADRRGPDTIRHLRKLYCDPCGAGRRWQPIRSVDGRVTGVYFSSDDEPLMAGELSTGYVRLSSAKRYRDWHFVPRLDR